MVFFSFLKIAEKFGDSTGPVRYSQSGSPVWSYAGRSRAMCGSLALVPMWFNDGGGSSRRVSARRLQNALFTLDRDRDRDRDRRQEDSSHGY